ncbi:hypothetical protein QAD02_006751 [Eretmocerus hayati]|uniref:Uncharacterized protein n=1 Tax=Eretmocerus hayati TaxID=131215 RepID=A0ACC2N448_9HYME|nr:hypothetical protein QAD02_006751 [Eretmocerus hayati]
MCSLPGGDYRACNNERKGNNQTKVIRLIGKRLYIDGFVYEMNYIDHNGKVHWQCVRYCRELGDQVKCGAKAVTSDPATSSSITLYEGLGESKHNHRPSLTDRKEAEALEQLENTIENKLQNTYHENDDSEFKYDSDTESSSELEEVSNKSHRTPEEINVDQQKLGLASNRPARSTANKTTYVLGLDYGLSSTPPRTIGRRLCIDGFIFNRSHSYGSRDLPKTHWLCRRYKSGGCRATAITSNPDLCHEVIVYKGPDESSHNHRPSPSEVDEAEEAANIVGTNDKSKSKITSQAIMGPTTAIAGPSTCHNSIGFRRSERLISAKKVQPDPENDLDSLPKLIGRKLCINGYIYNRNQRNADGRITWECRRYRSRGCHARSITSDPSESQKLIVYRGLKESKHDHPPSERDIEEAEKLVNFGVRRRRKRCVLASTATKKHSNRRERPLQTDSKSPKPHENPVKNSKSRTRPSTSCSAPDSEVGSDSSSPKVIGKRLCIDGYIYSPRSYYDTEIGWTCVRYQHQPTDGICSARATTSNYLKGGKVIVRQEPEQTQHNHPPSLAEVERAKEIVRLERSKSEKSNLRTTIQTCNNTRGLVKPRLGTKQERKLNLKRSLDDGPKSELSTLPRKCKKGTRKYCMSKNRSLLGDPDMYRNFLTRFSKRPIFDRKNVIDALRFIYKSKSGCIMGYATVLENRKNIEKDLEQLKKSPNAISFDGTFPIHRNNNEVLSKIFLSEEGTEANGTFVVPNNNIPLPVQNEIASEKNSRVGRRRTLQSNSDIQVVSSQSSTYPKRISRGREPTGIKKHSDLNSQIDPVLISDSSEDELEVASETKECSSLGEQADDNANSQVVSSPSATKSTESQFPDEPSTSVIDPSVDEFDVGQKLEKSVSPKNNERYQGVSKGTPQVPAAVSNKDQLSHNPSIIAIIDSSDEEIVIEQEIKESVSSWNIANKKETFKLISPSALVEPCEDRSTFISVVDLCEDEFDVGSKIRRDSSNDGKIDTEKVSEVFSDIALSKPIKNSIFPQQSNMPITDVTGKELRMKQEIPMFDLCDDLNGLQKCLTDVTKKEPVALNVPVQVNPPQSSTADVSSMFGSNRTQISGSIRLNPLCKANVVISGTKIQPQDQYGSPNVHVVRDGPMLNHISENFSNNRPYHSSEDVQV